MEQPPLDQVIEKLKKLDIHEWDISTYCGINNIHNLTVKNNGIIINLSVYARVSLPFENDVNYCISIQDENQKMSIDYKDHSKKGEIYKFYEKLCRNLDELKKNDFKKRIQDFIQGLESEKSDLEKIIEKLKDTNPKEWATDLRFIKKKHASKRPRFMINLCGLNFSLGKEILGYCVLKIRDLEGYNETVYPAKYDNRDVLLDAETRRMQTELIKRIYQNLYKGIKNKEKEFEGKIEAFLSD